MAEEPKAGVPNAVPPAQQPGTQTPPKPAEPPKPEGEKPPEPPKEPGAQTDPTQLLAALKEERDRRRAVESENTVLKQQRPSPVDMGVPTQSPQQQFAQQIQEALDAGDFQKAMNMNTMAAFGWYDSINANLETQRDACRSKYSDFGKYETLALAHVRRLPLNQRNAEGIVEMAYHVEKGKMADKIVAEGKQAQVDEIIRKINAGENIQGINAGGGQAPPPQGIQPTADQIKAAEAMGIPIVEYMKNIRK